MPSATRAESLVGISEVIDGNQSIGAVNPNISLSGFAMGARTSSRPKFPPLGPPEMLYVRKRYIPVVGAAKLHGYYHFVRGVDVSHAAAISAYIVDVVRNNGLDPLSWVATGGWEIASATFSSYNIMSKADAVVHVDFPGSTSVVGTGPDGREIELSDTFWAELMVSSVVRDILAVGEGPIYPSLRVISPYTATRTEPLFLDAAVDCAHRWYLSGVDTISGTTDFASHSRVATAIRDHFIKNARFDAAIEFFLRAPILKADPDCAVHAAAAARRKGDIERATNIIDDLIAKNTQSELAWTERAEILRARGELEKAMEAAKTAGSYSDDSVDVWVLLADLYVDLKEYGKAFEALNSADMPPPTLDPFLRKLVPNRKNITTPIEGAASGTDTVRVLATRLREERNMSSEKTDDTLAELPSKLMTDAERACYSVLVKILNDLSWDDMLRVRGECFVMETDVRDGRNVVPKSDGESEGPEGEGDDDHNDQDDDDNDYHENDGVVEESNDSYVAEDIQADVSPGDPVADEMVNGVAIVSLHDEAEDESNANEAGINGNGSSGLAAEERLRSLEQLGKSVCKPWLDYLVTNMYQDLRAMAMWSAEEQQHSAGAALVAALQAKKARGDSTAREPTSPRGQQDVESQERENDYRRSPEEVAKTSKRPLVDWLRRGELAFRLGKLEEAKTAYWTCVQLAAKEKIVAVMALLRLMELSAEDGDSKTALRTADAVWSYLDASTDRKQSSEPTPPVPEVRSCVFRLIAKNGLRAVRDVLGSEVEVDRKRMEGLLLDAVALRVEGFSR